MILTNWQVKLLQSIACERNQTPTELINDLLIDYLVSNSYETGIVKHAKSVLNTPEVD